MQNNNQNVKLSKSKEKQIKRNQIMKTVFHNWDLKQVQALNQYLTQAKINIRKNMLRDLGPSLTEKSKRNIYKKLSREEY